MVEMKARSREHLKDVTQVVGKFSKKVGDLDALRVVTSADATVLNLVVKTDYLKVD